jgi:hypothetical protein
MRIGSTFHPDVDPSSDLASKNRLIALKKYSNRLIFHTFWHVICKLMRADPDHNFYLMRIRILFDADTKMMRIDEDPDPQHCMCCQVQARENEQSCIVCKETSSV